MAGAVFGEVAMSLFVGGAVFGEVWKDSRSAKHCILQYKMRSVSAKGNLGCAAGCGLTGSWSDHGRIILGSCSNRPSNGNYVSGGFCPIFNMHFFVAGAAFGELHMLLMSLFRGRRNIW